MSAVSVIPCNPTPKGEFSVESTVKKLSMGTVYRLVGLGCLFSIVPFSVLMGLMAIGGADTLSWNNQPITGIKAVLVSPFIGVFISLLFTAIFGTLVWLGLWLHSFVRPMKLVYKPID